LKKKESNKRAKEMESLKEALKTEQEKSKDYLNRLKYLQADFENYMRRMEKELHSISERGNEKLIRNLLDVVDDLAKAVEVGKNTKNMDALREGVEMVYGNLCALLEREGLEKIKTVGQPFDPDTHEILAVVPSKEHENGIIVEEVRKGFMFKGKVLRPSIVNIVKNIEEGSEEK